MTGSTHPKHYIGRFAPSPTGPLHFGSLVSALGSFLDARAQHGQWLVRIEDLDPPREIPGAADAILRSLERHGLHWDGTVVYQSLRLQAYEEALSQLLKADLIYPCSCTRQMLSAMGGRYDNHCRQHPADPTSPVALRVKTNHLPKPFADAERIITFNDRCFQQQQESVAATAGDFIVKRKDGLFAYQLAVVVDDIASGITDIVRGADLLSSTARQLFLYRLLKQPAPEYAHLPLVLGRDGQKLSKQNHAPELQDNAASSNLWQALQFLGQQPPPELQHLHSSEILRWGIQHWCLERVPEQRAAYCNSTPKPSL